MGLFSRGFDRMQTEEQRYFATRTATTSGDTSSAGDGLDWHHAHAARKEERYNILRSRVARVGEIHRDRRGDWVLSGWEFADPAMPVGPLKPGGPVAAGLGSFTAADLVEIYERETGRTARRH